MAIDDLTIDPSTGRSVQSMALNNATVQAPPALGMGTPSPPTSSYDGSTNQFRAPAAATELHPALQAIIDKISGSPMKVGRATALVGLAGDIAGIQKQGMEVEAGMQRTGMTSQAGIEGERIKAQPHMLEQQRLRDPDPEGLIGKALGMGGKKLTPTGGKWYEQKGLTF